MTDHSKIVSGARLAALYFDGPFYLTHRAAIISAADALEKAEADTRVLREALARIVTDYGDSYDVTDPDARAVWEQARAALSSCPSDG